MAAYMRRLHHIAIHVGNVEKIAYDLVHKFKFYEFASRTTKGTKQLAFRKGAAVFIVNERPNSPNFGIDGTSTISSTDSTCLYDVLPQYAVDTACNVCFEVEDVERAFRFLGKQGCVFLVPPTEVCDDKGLVTYSVVKSIVGNVHHTLIDKTKYDGCFLPGFQEVGNLMNDGIPTDKNTESCPISHFDHITYACPRLFTPKVVSWYEMNFGFHRFFIESNEDVDEGYVVNQDGIGLRLTAMEYLKASETGTHLMFSDKKEPDCKFVIAESLPEHGSNQIETFLEQHRGPGIQHVGLYTEDIVSSAQTMAQAGVHFFCPPPAYYTGVAKQKEIEGAGHEPQVLSRNGILLDTDLRQTDLTCQATDTQSKRYLLQVFTKPIFREDTFFLELIERRGASGFGEGNIRALWKSVQVYMETERVVTQAENP